MTDNLRTWAERLAGGYLAGDIEVPGYDPDLLARARNNTHDAHHHLWDIDRTLARH